MGWPAVIRCSLVALCIGALTPRPAVAQSPAEVTLEIVHAATYHLPTAGGAMYYAVAEARNPGDAVVGDVVVRLVGYRADGSVVGEAKGYALVPALRPGESGPVVVVMAQAQPGEVARHELSVVGRAGAPEPFAPSLRLLGADRIWESPGKRYLVGELVSGAAETIGDLAIVAGFYSTDGRLLHVVRAPALVQPIAAGQRTPFLVEVPPDPTVNSWRLWYVAARFVGHPVPLAVRVATADADDYGRVVVSAVVTNQSSAAARDLRAVAILRDAQGRIVNVGALDPLAGTKEVPGYGEETLRLVADAQPGFASIEVRAASSTALLLAPERFGTFFPIVHRPEVPRAADETSHEDQG
ncbi:MAG: hypothetical protein HY691_02730 [Chloroflexi bacterium]|nr:hypothetical protein [Chloroflexota bacterium]